MAFVGFQRLYEGGRRAVGVTPVFMDHDDRAVIDARLQGLHSDVLRGLSLAALRRAEEVREERRATRAAIEQRRLTEARRGPHSRIRPPARRAAAPR